MKILFFLFGACVASLVWAFILMRILDYDIKAFDDTHELLREFIEVSAEQTDNMNENIEKICDTATAINNGNHDFRMEVLKLVDIIASVRR